MFFARCLLLSFVVVMAATAPTTMEAVLAKLIARQFPVEALPADIGDPVWLSMRTEYELTLHY